VCFFNSTDSTASTRSAYITYLSNQKYAHQIK